MSETTMSGDEITPLLSAVQARYGSLDDPSFSFVERVVEEKPYRALTDQLQRIATIDEATDVNDDVRFVYSLRHDGGEWSLMLSTLGPYAVLLRREGKTYRVSETGTKHAWLEERIHKLLAEHGVRLLSRQILETPVALRLHNTEPGRARLFQALFTDTDFLPWDAANSL